jgi:hypothetical protein
MMAKFSLRSPLAAVLLLVTLLPISSYSQDQSTIYFYRSKESTNVAYEVKEGSTSVGIMRPSNVVVYKCNPGAHDFLATGKVPTSFKMDTEAGKEYFVRCDVDGDAAHRANFQLTHKVEARMEISRIDGTVASQIVPTALTTSPDTIRALRHMYKRKRGWGIVWSILGTSAIITSIKQIADPPKVDIGYGQTIESGNVGTNILSLTASVALASLGYSREVQYTNRRLAIILEDRAAGAPWPPKLLKKLRPRDFVVK